MTTTKDFEAGTQEEFTENEQAKSGSSATLIRAVCIDNLVFPDMLIQEQVNALADLVEDRLDLGPVDKDGNVTLPLDIPRNTLVVRMITPGEQTKYRLCYPLFPPHMTMPVQPGEQVWVMKGQKEGKQIFWIARIPGNVFTDDINYTHLDRALDIKTTPDTKQKYFQTTGAAAKFLLPNFLNGDGQSARTLGARLKDPDGKESDEDDYDKILEKAKARYVDAGAPRHAFEHEAVPRFTKRPGDLVLQGSNNSLICLGTDRGWSEHHPPAGTSNAVMQEVKPYSGTVDIVAGRARHLPKNPTNDMVAGDVAEETSPETILNSRGYAEVAKNVEVNDLTNNNFEGDPDFRYDASRLYVSMNTNPDENFNTAPSFGNTFEGSLPETKDVPAAVLKSDHIRIIARKQDAAKVHDSAEINGSIQIIKEGKPGEDAASITILPDGSIHIKGSKIFFTDQETAKKKGEGPGSSEPYMRFSDFKVYMNDTIDLIVTDMEHLQADIKRVADALASAHFIAPAIPAAPAPLIPGPVVVGEGFLPGVANAMIAAGGDYGINAAMGTEKSKDKAMDPIKSEKIFGD